MRDFSKTRQRMVREQVVKRGIQDTTVQQAMETVERHRFVDDLLAEEAYKDRPLPIGFSQTISQPYIVALMSESLCVSAGDKILEIGTGSGYQAAVLAEMGIKVFTIERNPVLGKKARRTLDALGYQTVVTRVGDGTHGWREFAPFQGIIVTAGAPVAPATLMKQLEQGGRLVVPVGDMKTQELRLYEKTEESFVTQNLGSCAFVPLIGSEGWTESE